MKKLLALIMLCLAFIFISYTGNDTVVKEAKAVRYTPAPDHYYMEHETVKNFVEWIKGPTAKTDNQGVFSYVVDRYKNYGYIICPYGESDEDIKIEFTGLRPGEKLYEELLMDEEGMQDTENKLIHIGKPIEIDEVQFFKQLDELNKATKSECADVKRMIKEIVPTYNGGR